MQVQEKLKNSSENFWEGNVKARNNNTMGVKKIAFTDAFNSTNVDITYCRRVNECITYLHTDATFIKDANKTKQNKKNN